MTKASMLLLLVCMSIMGARPYSHPKATPIPKAIDVGQFPIDSDQTILPSDRSREVLVKWNTVDGLCISNHYLATTDGVGREKIHGKWEEAERDPSGAIGSQDWGFLEVQGRTFLSEAECWKLCKSTPKFTGCAYQNNQCIPYIGNIRGGKPLSNARCHFRQEYRFKCFDWTNTDLTLIRQEGKSQKETCERYENFVFTEGDGAKAPGCGSCWCCQPDYYFNYFS